MDTPFLVALALMERDGRRAMPLCGGSRPAEAVAAADPGEAGCRLALELLLRLFQQSDVQVLQRAAADDSLLLLEIPLEAMTTRLPELKAAWLSGGATAALLQDLQCLALRGWRLQQAKYEALRYEPWPCGASVPPQAVPAVAAG